MNLTEIPLFDILTEVTVDSKFYDIHNNFILEKFCFSDKSLIIELASITEQSRIVFEFEDYVIFHGTLLFSTNENTALGNFHRGRYELSNNLFENYNGRYCFYFEFYPDGELSILSRNASLKVISI